MEPEDKNSSPVPPLHSQAHRQPFGIGTAQQKAIPEPEKESGSVNTLNGSRPTKGNSVRPSVRMNAFGSGRYASVDADDEDEG